MPCMVVLYNFLLKAFLLGAKTVLVLNALLALVWLFLESLLEPNETESDILFFTLTLVKIYQFALSLESNLKGVMV